MLNKYNEWIDILINFINDEYKDASIEQRRLIDLKLEHTLSVMGIMKMILSKMNYSYYIRSESDYDLAMFIAFAHDFGRFEEAMITNKFTTGSAFDHANHSITLLYDNKIIRYLRGISEFTNMIDQNEEIIRKAISNHNRVEIESDLSDRELFFVKLIRDADKIDIYRSVMNISRNRIFEDIPNMEVLELFHNKQNIDISKYRDLRANTFVMRAGWVSLLYFDESRDILRETGYLEYYIDNMDVNDDVKDIFDKIISITLNRLNNIDTNESILDYVNNRKQSNNTIEVKKHSLKN